MVCPWDGDRCCWTLHWNCLLPISNNLEQTEDEISVVGVEPFDEPTLVPPADKGLPADSLTKSQPESLLNLLLKQHKLVDLELTGSAAPDSVNDGSQAVQDQLAPLRQSACTIRNQLPWRYWNYALQENNTSPSAFDMPDGLHTCLHLMVGLYNTLGKSTV